MSELVVVAVRVRPPRLADALCCVSAGDSPGAVITTDTSEERKGKQLAFGFARGFFWNSPESSSTRAVYDAVGRALLEQALKGYNTSLLAYGQTGARAAPARRVAAPGRKADKSMAMYRHCRLREDAHVLRHGR